MDLSEKTCARGDKVKRGLKVADVRFTVSQRGSCDSVPKFSSTAIMDDM